MITSIIKARKVLNRYGCAEDCLDRNCIASRNYLAALKGPEVTDLINSLERHLCDGPANCRICIALFNYRQAVK